MGRIQVTCECGRSYSLDAKHAGRKAKCACQRVFSIPNTEEQRAPQQPDGARDLPVTEEGKRHLVDTGSSPAECPATPVEAGSEDAPWAIPILRTELSVFSWATRDLFSLRVDRQDLSALCGIVVFSLIVAVMDVRKRFAGNFHEPLPISEDSFFSTPAADLLGGILLFTVLTLGGFHVWRRCRYLHVFAIVINTTSSAAACMGIFGFLLFSWCVTLPGGVSGTAADDIFAVSKLFGVAGFVTGFVGVFQMDVRRKRGRQQTGFGVAMIGILSGTVVTLYAILDFAIQSEL